MEDRFKFRVFLKAHNYMANVHTLHTGTNKVIVSSHYGNCSVEINDYNILMQCTGLKDKNGKLIYEGDIVKINENYVDWSAIDDFYRKQNFVVEYSEHQARYILKANKFKDNSGDGIYDLSPDFYEFLKWQPSGKISRGTLDFIEVLGNIYENSDLLSEVEG